MRAIFRAVVPMEIKRICRARNPKRPTTARLHSSIGREDTDPCVVNPFASDRFMSPVYRWSAWHVLISWRTKVIKHNLCPTPREKWIVCINWWWRILRLSPFESPTWNSWKKWESKWTKSLRSRNRANWVSRAIIVVVMTPYQANTQNSFILKTNY